MKTKWTPESLVVMVVPGPYFAVKGSREMHPNDLTKLAAMFELAPEMAEALRAFVEWADGNHYPKGWANPPTLPANMARSLLARLEGGEK